MKAGIQDPTSAATSQLSDEEVVAFAGDTAFFEVLMRRYNQRLLRITRSILRDADEAEDAAQEPYVRADTSRHQFEGRAQFSTWLIRIAVHEAFTRLNKRKRLEDLQPRSRSIAQSLRRGPSDAHRRAR